MQQLAQGLFLSATDLAIHLVDDHATTLATAAATGHLDTGADDNALLNALADEGLAHEARYVQQLIADGHQVTDLSDTSTWSLARRVARTNAAMRAGDEYIFQASLRRTSDTGQFAGKPIQWNGRADLLIRVDGASKLGDYHYEVIDTKLALEPRPQALIQVSNYSWQLQAFQEVLPTRLHIVTGDMATHSFAVNDFRAYHKMLMRDLEHVVVNPRNTYAQPNRFTPPKFQAISDAQLIANDDLALIRGLQGHVRAAMIRSGIRSVYDLSQLHQSRNIQGVNHDTVTPFRMEAVATVRTRQAGGRAKAQLIDTVRPGRGLATLWEPTSNDLYLDFEGDPTRPDSLQAVLGVGRVGSTTGLFITKHFDSLDFAEEKVAFTNVMDTIAKRFDADPAMHVHAYGSYEVTKLRAMAQRHGLFEAELHALERAGVFVDLHTVVHQSMRTAHGDYGLKSVERLWDQKRTADITDVNDAIIELRRISDSSLSRTQRQQSLRKVAKYNGDDLQSLYNGHMFLEATRARRPGIPRPKLVAERSYIGPLTFDEDAKRLERLAKAQVRKETAIELQQLLLDRMPADASARTADDNARQLLWDLSGMHRREAIPQIADYYRRLEMKPDELLEDNESIGRLRYLPRVERESLRQSWVYTYSFPAGQSQSFKVGDIAIDPRTGKTSGTVQAIEYGAGDTATIRLSRGKRSQAAHPTSIIPDLPPGSDSLNAAIVELARYVGINGLSDASEFRAAQDLLTAHGPRIAGRSPDEPVLTSDTEADYLTVVRNLDNGVLFNQGGPGTGKTSRAALVLMDALRTGKRVAICASSHAAVNTVIEITINLYEALGKSPPLFMHKGTTDQVLDHPFVQAAKTNEDVAIARMNNDVNVIAGTPYLFADPTIREDQFDLLIIDEAAQMTLANGVIAAMAAKNVVLFGDPRQLAQPTKGAHPGDSGKSVMELMIKEPTIAPTDGIFLPQTYRMTPKQTELVSHISYGDRLKSAPQTARQQIASDHPFTTPGTKIILVDHVGTGHASVDEAVVVKHLVRKLTGLPWVGPDGETRVLRPDDMLVQTPWNQQVGLLRHTLADVSRVMTVDSAQGQEAPVAIYSLVSASSDGIERSSKFVMNANRLTTALSRSQTTTYIVMSPSMLMHRANSSTEQLKAVNNYWEMVDASELFQYDADTDGFVHLKGIQPDFPTALSPELQKLNKDPAAALAPIGISL